MQIFDCLRSYLDSDVKQIVGNHLGSFGRSPAFPAACVAGVLVGAGVGLALAAGGPLSQTDIWIDQLHVVQPGEEVVQQALGHRRARRLQTVTDF